MKDILGKVFNGFLTGLGFSVVLGFVYYYITQQITQDAMSMYSFDPETVEISKHRKLEREGKLLILGEVSNVGENQAKGVNVIVDLYLNDEFVKQCDENISGGVPSYDTRNFEVFCSGGCSKSRIVKHDSYKIYVSGY